MRRILFVGAVGALVALPSALAFGPRGGGGGHPAPHQAPQRPSPAMSRPAQHAPAQRPAAPANRSSFGPAHAPAQRPSFSGSRPSPGGLNHAAPSPSVIRPAGQAGARQPINHALPSSPSPSLTRPGGGGSVIRPGAGGGGGTQYRPPQGSVIRPGAGGSGTQVRPGQGALSRPGAGGSGTQLRPDRPNIGPSRPGQGGGGTQLRPDRPNILPSRPGQGGSGTQLRPDSRPGQGGGGEQWQPNRPNVLPSRPGQGGSGTQWQPDRPGTLPSRPGQGGSGTQWQPDRPNILPSRPGQGGSGTQWRPDRPINPDRPNRPIINNGTANIGNRVINNNVNNVNTNQWNQYNRNVVAGGGYNRPWYGSPGYWNQPFYGGLSAGYWSRPWNNFHFGWLSGYSSGLFTAIPSFWAGSAAATAFDTSPTFAFSNPYFEAPQVGDTNIVIQGLNYTQPIPAPTVEQTVIAYPPAPDQADVQAGEPLPTTPPPPPPEDDTATAANKLFDAARAAFKDGRYADAQAQAEQAIAKLPSDAALHEFRCLCLFAQGKYKDAAAGLYAVLAAGPGWNWETVRGLYGNADDYTKQLRALEGYVKDHPDAAEGHFLLAYHYLVLGSKNDAVNQFKEVVRVQPNDKLSAELVNALTTTPKEVASAGQ